MTKISWRPQQSAYRQLLRAFCHEAEEVVVVGGVVRDLLLHDSHDSCPISDLDLLLPVAALTVARRVADRLGWAYYALDERRGLARLVLTAERGQAFVCDVSSYFGTSLEDDLRGRDFTINAMAFVASEQADGRFGGELIDLSCGREDLRDGCIRQAGAQSLHDDPVRLIRAVRFAAQLGFTIVPETREQIALHAERIQLSSRERIRDELWKTLATGGPTAAIAELRALGLLRYLLPDLQAAVGIAQSAPHHLDVFEHTLLAVERAAFLRDWLLDEQGPAAENDTLAPAVNLAVQAMLSMLSPWLPALVEHFRARCSTYRTRAAWLPWHALLHDVGKPSTRSEEISGEGEGEVRIRFFGHEEAGAALVEDLLSGLRFSGDEVRLGKRVARTHMRPHHLNQSFGERPISRRACYRFFRDVGFDGDDRPCGVDVILLALADRLATGNDLSPSHLDSSPSSKAWAGWQAYLAHMHQLLDFAFNQSALTGIRAQPLANGTLLIERLGLKPGPLIGRLLDHLAEAQAAGDIETEEAALRLAAKYLTIQRLEST